jgi:hypothetical protein
MMWKSVQLEDIILSVNATDTGHLLTLLPEDLSPRCAVDIVCSKHTDTIRVVVKS